ncbi:MAG: lipopolysaccharide biosynthesis protein [Planctomycetota bacterium]|nr:lipopolysaccharide biosynthesis protein [Planctomycetota bacterium]
MPTLDQGDSGEANEVVAPRDSKELGAKTTSGLLWMASSNVLRTSLKIFFFFLLGNLLAPKDFGVIAASTIIISFSNILSDLGISQAIIYLPQLTKRSIASAGTFSLITGVLLACMVLAASPICGWFFENDEVVPVLAFLSLIFVFRGVSNVAEGLIRRDLRFKILAVRETAIFFLAQGCIGVPLAFFGFGYWSLAIAQLTSEVVRCIVILSSERRVSFGRMYWNELKPLFEFGSGVSLGTIINRVAVQADNVIVGSQLGFDQLGVYSRAYQLAAMPANNFGSIGSRVLFPALTAINQDRSKVRRVFEDIVTAVATLALPGSVVLACIAPPWVLYLLGPKWANMLLPFQILSFAIYFRLGYKIHGTVIRSLGKTKVQAIMQLEYLIGISTGAYIGSKFGLEGIAIGVAFAVTLHYVLMAKVAGNLLSIPLRGILAWHWRGLLSAVLVLGLAALCTIAFPLLSLEFTLLFSVLTSFLCLASLVARMPLLLRNQDVEKLVQFARKKRAKSKKQLTS